ncbi:hypothetical protein V1282_003994 [Nitrobacteraceae bacterium AZCC 2146]
MLSSTHRRVLSGLDKRLNYARLSIDNNPRDHLEVEGMSLRFLNLKSEGAAKSSPELDLLRICLQYRSLADQARLLSAIGTSRIAELTRLLTMGSTFSLDTSPVAGLDDTDYSIAAFEHVLSKPSENSEFKRAVSNRVRSFLRKIGAPRVATAGSFVRYLYAFGLHTDKISNIDGILNAFHSLKQAWWPVLGPDLLSVFQALSDPMYEISERQLVYGYELAVMWNLSDLFIKLVAIRALGGFRLEGEFLRAHSKAETDALVLASMVIVNGIDSSVGYHRVSNNLDPLNQILSLCLNMAIAVRRRELVVFKKQLVRLYQVDQRAYAFLDWQVIHEAFELAAIDADPYSIFIKYLMSTPPVVKRFIAVAFARGRGQLTADISSFVNRLRGGATEAAILPRSHSPPSRSRRKATNEFVHRFRILPSRSRQRLMQEILDKGMMERLAFAFPSSIKLAAESLPRVDNQSSVLRMELANIAKRELILTAEQADRIIDDEAHFLRMHLFHNLFKAGRIKIDWEYLTFTIARTIETQFDFVLSDQDETSVTSGVVSTVVGLFAQEVADQLLFDSESSLEQSLGNNLRHGVIVPRFLRAFNEAVIASTDLNQNQIGDLTTIILRHFDDNAHRILQLRDFVTAALNQYKDFWLIVDRNGSFYARVKDDTSQALVAKIAGQRHLDSWDAADHIVGVFRGNVEEVLRQAREELLGNVKQAIISEISSARRECRQADISRTPVFFDLLDENILASFDEVGSWLGLIKIDNDVPDFQLLDLINFEAVSLIFSDLKKLKVRYSSYMRNGATILKLRAHPKIRGIFFEPIQEIVHNLISNAYRHSGLGMNTDIEFSLIIDGQDLIFRCVNTFSDKNYVLISEEHSKVQASIKSDVRIDSSTDTKSGFFKIKSVCGRVFSAVPDINLPPLSAKARKYIVEIKVPDVSKDALVQ